MRLAWNSNTPWVLPGLLGLLGLLACNGDTTTDSGTTTTDSGEPVVGCSGDAGCMVAEGLAAGLLCVRALAADDVWFVGASLNPDDDSGPVVLHYDGTAFERLDTSAFPGGELWWAWVTADETVFVGHEGLILEMSRADGVMAKVEGPDSGITFFGVWGASTDDLWAVGMSDGGDGPPALWRRLDGVWASWEDPSYGPGDDKQIYYKVHGTGLDDLWIVGTNGTALHWGGAGLTKVETDADTNTDYSQLLTVDVGGEQPIAVGGSGNGLILEYDGSDWLNRSPDFEPSYNGVCTGAGAAWAVGVRGIRAKREADGTWSSDRDRDVASQTDYDWHGCTVAPDGALWTVGGRISQRPLIEGIIGYQGLDEPPEVVFE